LKNIKLSTALLTYPYFGQISQCTDRGFGFIKGPEGEEWIHFRDHAGRRLNTMEGLEGKPCAFVIGGHPFRHSQGKMNWSRSVVQWLLLDDADPSLTPQTYEKERRKALLALDKGRLHSVLSAKWYLQLWKKSTGGKPKAVLMADPSLNGTLKESLASCNGIEELMRLLAAICSSPWYGLNEDDRSKVCQNFLQAADWPLNVFLVSKPIKSCRGYGEIWPLCGDMLEGYIRKARTIAIDLESNGETIYQFGWKNATGTDLRANRYGFSHDDLCKAVGDCLSGQNSPCIVGQNLLSWDWLILQKHEAPFPESSALWDTLIASWLLEPWTDSHALIVEENAHRADADAAACYELFENQIAHLAPCLNGSEIDICKLVDKLFDDPSLLLGVQEREYPSDFCNIFPTACVYPSNRIYEIAWQKNCNLKLIAPENRLADPTLSPEFCHDVAAEQNDILAKVVSIVVTNAEVHGVHLRLSNLSQWLVGDQLRSALKLAHNGYEPTKEENAQVFYVSALLTPSWQARLIMRY